MKKLLSLILVICMVVLMSPSNVAVQATDNTFNLSDEISVQQNENNLGTENNVSSGKKTPEELAIEKIINHKTALGEDVSDTTRGMSDKLVDGGVYYIKNYFSGKYLNVHYGVDANGTNVYQWTGDSSTEQKFKIVKQSTSYSGTPECYKIYAMCSSNGNNRVIDVVRNGSPLASGQNVDIWTPVDNVAQKIKLTTLTMDNLYHMQMDNDLDYYITAYGNSNGTSGGKTATSAGNVFIKEFNINDNQQWQFIKVTSAPINISGNYPYHTGDYNLFAGESWCASFTPSASYDCSIFTSGNLDTVINVYTNSNYTNAIATNDDGGHGTNALVHFNVTSGTTYYIKVTGYSSSTSGSFKFVLHRGLPTSQSEKGNLYDLFNSSTYQSKNNCYTYALGYHKNPITNYLFRYNGQNPGEMKHDAEGNESTVHVINIGDLVDAVTAKSAIETALTQDCSYFGGDWNEIGKTTQPRAGYYKVALVADVEGSAKDYHWYRQLPNGQWVHKLSVSQAVNVDRSNEIIYDPSTCNRDYTDITGYNYSVFLGWYEINTPEISTNSILTENNATLLENVKLYNSESFIRENKSTMRDDLTMNDISKLYIGMPYEEVIKVLGTQHKMRYASVQLGYIYVLNDNTEIVIAYNTNGALSLVELSSTGEKILSE